MPKYYYKKYLYGNHSKRNNCSEFKNGNCSMSIDSCPGFEECSIYKQLKMNTTSTNFRNEKNTSKINCTVEIRPEKDVIENIFKRFSTHPFVNLYIEMKTIMQNADLRALNIRSVYICYNNLYYFCQLNDIDIPLIDSGKFVKTHFEFEKIVLSKESIEKTALQYFGVDDYYGEIYIRKDETVPCNIEIGAKQTKIQEIINKIKINFDYSFHIAGKIKNKKIDFNKMSFEHIYIGYGDSRYELVFDKKRSRYKEENEEAFMYFIIINAIPSPKKSIHTKAQASILNDELSSIIIRKCPIE